MTVRFSTWEHSLIFAMANHRTRRNEHILFSLESCPCTTMGHLFTRSVVSNSLWHHELQHTRPPCPSPTPGVHPDPCPLSQWCHPAISSSIIPLSSCPQSFPASGSFQMSAPLLIRWPKCWSFSFNISPSNEHPGLVSFRMDWLDLLEVQGTLKNLLQPTVQKHQFFSAQLSL